MENQIYELKKFAKIQGTPQIVPIENNTKVQVTVQMKTADTVEDLDKVGPVVGHMVMKVSTFTNDELKQHGTALIDMVIADDPSLTEYVPPAE